MALRRADVSRGLKALVEPVQVPLIQVLGMRGCVDAVKFTRINHQLRFYAEAPLSLFSLFGF